MDTMEMDFLPMQVDFDVAEVDDGVICGSFHLLEQYSKQDQGQI